MISELLREMRRHNEHQQVLTAVISTKSPSIYLPFSLCRERPVLLSPQNILLNPAKSHFLSHKFKKPFRDCGDMVMWHRRPALHLAAGPHPLGEVGNLSSPCLKRGRMMVGPKEVPGSL